MQVYTGIIAILSFFLILFIISTIVKVDSENAVATASSSSSSFQQNEKLKTFQNSFCGTNSMSNSTEYVTEYVLPQNCEMPLGIEVDIKEDRVWYVSTKKGILGSYDTKEDKFNEEMQIPTWQSRNNDREFSQVWDVEIDNQDNANGDVWFTDGKQNAIWRFITSTNSFERYTIPGQSQDFGTTYPSSIEFNPNNDNIVYFVGMFSPSIWIAEIDRLKNGTSEGITEIPIPIEGFEETDPVFVTTGSLAFDEKENALWVSMMIYGYKGQIIKYSLDNKSFDAFDLPSDLNSPWGLTIDDNSNLWVTNAGTSIFYKLSPGKNNDDDSDGRSAQDFEIEKFVTSKGSFRIFGKLPESGIERDFQNRYYTLPSMVKVSNDGLVWFNEQHGNKLSKFDPSTEILIEYWVPTQNRLWGICSNDDISNNNSSIKNNDICGIANVLQFSIGKDDKQIWFSEWSQNKIGKVEAVDDVPFSIDVFESDEELTIERDQKEKIKLSIKSESESDSSLSSFNNKIRLVASGTFTSSGDIGNSTGYFEQPSSISMEEGEEQEVSFEFIPSTDLEPGDYTLMIGAENNSISYLRAVKIKII
jgi:virginiamycin B lyase